MKNSNLNREIKKYSKINNDSFLRYEVRRNSFRIKSYFREKSYLFYIEDMIRK